MENKKYLINENDGFYNSDTSDITVEPDTIVKRIKNIIAENYPDRLTVEEIAVRISYSKKQTQRIFLKETGKTVYEYLTEFRMEKAKEMLLCQDAKISSVAESVGYKNVAHFKELFEKYTGISPAYYKGE